MVIKFDENKSNSIDVTVTVTSISDALSIEAESASGKIDLAVYCGEIALLHDDYYHGGKTIQNVHAWMMDLCRGVEDHPAAKFVMRIIYHELDKYENEVK